MSDDLLSDTPSAGSTTGTTGGSSGRRWFQPHFSRPSGGLIWRIGKWVALILLVLAVFYYPIGMMIVHQINDDPSFGDVKAGATAAPAGASQAVATAAALIDREVNQSPWPENDPPFMPGWLLDNMPNFQVGIID